MGPGQAWNFHTPSLDYLVVMHVLLKIFFMFLVDCLWQYEPISRIRYKLACAYNEDLKSVCISAQSEQCKNFFVSQC